MPLSVLCSLGLMLQLMSSLMHFVALVTPAWVQLGVFVPAFTAGGGGGGSGEGEGSNNGTVSGYSASDNSGAPDFVKVRLGLWGWCQQFRLVSPSCQEPGFLTGVQVMAAVALGTLLLSFLLLLIASRLNRDTKKRRVLTLVSLLASFLSAIILMVAVATYAILTRREVTHLMSLIGEDAELPYLGWAFGADVVSSILVGLAAIFISIDLQHSSKSSHQFQLVV